MIRRQVLVKMNAIPIIATQGLNIAPNMKQTITAKLSINDQALEHKPIQGDAVSWITTNRDGFSFHSSCYTVPQESNHHIL